MCYVYVKIIRNLFTRVSLRFDVRKGNSKKNDDWGYGEPFGGEFPHFQFSPSFSVGPSRSKTCRIYGVFGWHSSGQVAVKLKTSCCRQPFQTRAHKVAILLTYRDVIEVVARLEKQHSFLNLRIWICLI